MNTIKTFLKVTIVGGLMFLVPVVLLIVLLGHAMRFAGKVAAPLAATIPDSLVSGRFLAASLAALILLLIAFLAGLIARSGPGRRITGWFEESILGGMPQYRMVKSMAEGLTQLESGTDMQPVLMRTDECWQLGYRLEDLPGGWVAVFIPSAPTPMSGNVLYVSTDRIQPLAIGMAEAMKLVKRLGIGSAASLRDVNLGKPL